MPGTALPLERRHYHHKNSESQVELLLSRSTSSSYSEDSTSSKWASTQSPTTPGAVVRRVSSSNSCESPVQCPEDGNSCGFYLEPDCNGTGILETHSNSRDSTLDGYNHNVPRDIFTRINTPNVNLMPTQRSYVDARRSSFSIGTGSTQSINTWNTTVSSRVYDKPVGSTVNTKSKNREGISASLRQPDPQPSHPIYETEPAHGELSSTIHPVSDQDLSRYLRRRKYYHSDHPVKIHRPNPLRRRNLLVISLISVVMSVVCILCFTLNFLKTPGHVGEWTWRDQVHDEGVIQICVPCLSLRGGLQLSDEDVERFQKLKNNVVDEVNNCCARTSDEMSALIHVLARQRLTVIELMSKSMTQNQAALHLYKKDNFKQNRDMLETPVSAHKRLYPPDQPKHDSSKRIRLTFQPGDSLKEHAVNVNVTKTTLVIRHTGWYYVYSSLRFYVSSMGEKDCRQHGEPTWWHYITLHKGSKSDTMASSQDLTKSLTQRCDVCSGHDATSYTGGVFLLEEGQHISVEIIGAAIDDSAASFVGMVMLGSQ